MTQRLKDKVILVTGSTTGIGEGMVRVFAREGAKVLTMPSPMPVVEPVTRITLSFRRILMAAALPLR